MNRRLEVASLPVTDVDKAKHFYETKLGCRPDADVSPRKSYRIVQATPPGPPCSIILGDCVTAAQPAAGGSLMLVVDDIAASREELVSHGVEVTEVPHAEGGGYGAGFHPRAEGHAPGPDPDGLSYATFASSSDPDSNTSLLPEITERLPGRV
jgi:catechol 2,3-dioxygenase-like lactoylglutathione lyase family enzyme